MTVRASLPLFTAPTRARLVERLAAERQPSQRIRDLSPGYRAATEALQIAADYGCDGRLYDALWRLCMREHDLWLASAARQGGRA